MKTLKTLAAFLLFWLTSFELIFPAASKASVLFYMLIEFILRLQDDLGHDFASLW